MEIIRIGLPALVQNYEVPHGDYYEVLVLRQNSHPTADGVTLKKLEMIGQKLVSGPTGLDCMT